MADERHNQLQVDLLIAVQHLHCLDGVVRVSARHSRVNACICFAAYLNFNLCCIFKLQSLNLNHRLTLPVFQGACITGPAFQVFCLFLLLLRPEIAPLPKAFFPPGPSLLLLRNIPNRRPNILLMPMSVYSLRCHLFPSIF